MGPAKCDFDPLLQFRTHSGYEFGCLKDEIAGRCLNEQGIILADHGTQRTECGCVTGSSIMRKRAWNYVQRSTQESDMLRLAEPRCGGLRSGMPLAS
jgi:hypothetical protein